MWNDAVVVALLGAAAGMVALLSAFCFAIGLDLMSDGVFRAYWIATPLVPAIGAGCALLIRRWVRQ